ncbi:MAG: GNAT family N-acetyltransferase [Pseudomonadota bacterium]
MVRNLDISSRELTGLKLREAEHRDVRQLFEWRNLPEIIDLGVTKKSVGWQEHLSWFERVLDGNSILIWIIEYEDRPIGQVRFDAINNQEAEISIYLIPGETGKGRGSVVIALACKRIKTVWKDLKSVDARILSENQRSLKAFENAGFVRSSIQCSQQIYLTRLF